MEEIKVKCWKPPAESRKFNVSDFRKLLQKIPEDFSITIDDFDFIFYEIDWEDKRIDFSRDYKGD